MLVFLLFLFQTIACEDAYVRDYMEAVNARWAEIQDMIEDGRTADALNSLRGVKNALAALDATCYDLAFGGNDDTVIGPVSIPGGIYRMTMTTEGSLFANLTLLNGECGVKTIAPATLYILQSDGAPTGAEKIFESAGCSALIDVRSVRAPWSLSFERIQSR